MKSILLYVGRRILLRLAKQCLRYAKVEDHWLVSAGRDMAFPSAEDALRALLQQDHEQYELQSLLGSRRSSRWDNVRDNFLKTHPRCEACGGQTELQVHHEKPFHLFPELELEETNLITLCNAPWRRCHFIFGHCNNWSTYNPFVREDAALHLKRIKERRRAA